MLSIAAAIIISFVGVLSSFWFYYSREITTDVIVNEIMKYMVSYSIENDYELEEIKGIDGRVILINVSDIAEGVKKSINSNYRYFGELRSKKNLNTEILIAFQRLTGRQIIGYNEEIKTHREPPAWYIIPSNGEWSDPWKKNYKVRVKKAIDQGFKRS